MQTIDITINRHQLSIASVDLPVLYSGNLVLMRCALVDSSGSAIVLPADSEFYASLDSTFGPSHTDLVVAGDDDFNDTDDWADADPTAGKLCFKLSTDVTAIHDMMSTQRRKVVHLEIWTREPAGAWMLLMHESVLIFNTSADLS